MRFGKEHWFTLVGLLVVIGLYSLFVYFPINSGSVMLSPATNCTPNWNCSKWIPEDCSSGTQRRACIDMNGCGTSVGKPSEQRPCPVCEPKWVCSEWDPSKCTEEGQVLERDCNDVNGCGKETGKPNEKKTCEAKSGGNGMLWKWVVIALIVLSIPIMVLIIIWVSKRFD